MKNSVLNKSIQNGSMYALAGTSVGIICMFSRNKSVRLLGVGFAAAGVGTWIAVSAANNNSSCDTVKSVRSVQNITYANKNVRNFVEKYAIKQCNKKGKMTNRRFFNQKFADIYSKIQKAPEQFYITNEVSYLRNPKSEGEFHYDGSRFIIIFKDNPNLKFGNRAGAMFEEFYHASQFLEGKIWFEKHNHHWLAIGSNALIEYEAKKFATNAYNYGDTYKHIFDINNIYSYIYAKTQLGLIAEMNQGAGMYFLTNGHIYYKPDINGKVRAISYDAPYPELLNVSTIIPNRQKKQITNLIYAYPFP